MDARKFGSVHLLAVVLSVALNGLVMGLWRSDLAVPFAYGGDANTYGLYAQGIIEDGWALRFQRVGAPGCLHMEDFPKPESLHFALFRILAIFSDSHAAVVNLFYLATFPLTALVSVFVLRRLGISDFLALLGSLCYAFLPYHYLRGPGHLFLAAYYLVPLSVWLALRIWDEIPPFFAAREDTGPSGPGFCLRSRSGAGALASCLLVSCTSVYYSFFSCYFLAVAGIAASVRRRNLRHFASAAILGSTIAFGLFLNLSPNLLYWLENGTNPEAVIRLPQEAERYSLKISQLVLPVPNHRIGAFARLRETYEAPNRGNENAYASLGLLGSAGFLFLLGWLFLRPGSPSGARRPDDELLERLSLLNLAAILFATVGGFGSLFALSVSGKIRCYNRASVFVAFFSLAAVLILAQRFSESRVRSRRSRWIFCGAALFVFAAAILDQTTPNSAPRYRRIERQYRNDAAFVAKIEARMPEGARIFQLPYMPFPEAPSAHRLGSYDHFQAYFHSRKLMWSYGAMRGRSVDRWQARIASEDAAEMLREIACAGFEGVWFDRWGYRDPEKAESRLREMLGGPHVLDKEGRRAFYDMRDYVRSLRLRLGEDEWCRRCAASREEWAEGSER